MNLFPRLNGVSYPFKHPLTPINTLHISQIEQKNGPSIMTTIGNHPRTVLSCVYRCLPHHLTPSGEGIPIKTFRIRLRMATVLMC
jgi:hypothetical protein